MRDKKPQARYKLFVVVMPINQLTPAYCKLLMKVYRLSFCLGSPAMNFSVYLIGSRIAIPDEKFDTAHAGVFGYWCATALFMRIGLYIAFHDGYPQDVNAIVKLQHDITNGTDYVKSRTRMLIDDEFVNMFKRTSVINASAIREYTADTDYTSLTDDIPDDDLSHAAGVQWQ